MDFHQVFEVAGGSCQGRDHKNTNRNCHDAYRFEFREDLIVAVVCDGCGSGTHSEVGAKLGAMLITDQIIRHMSEGVEPSIENVGVVLSRVQRSVLSRLGALADSMPGSFSKNVADYFLFTAVGSVITPAMEFTFACGDGLIVENDEVIDLSSEKSPDYMSYGLVESGIETSKLQVLSMCSTDHLDHVLIATDGIHDFRKSSSVKIPGKDEHIGDLSQFWKDDRFFKNPFWITNRLNLINREVHHVDYAKKVSASEYGPLKDDTTLVVIRRKVRKA